MDLEEFKALVVKKAKTFIENNPSIKTTYRWDQDKYFQFRTNRACFRENTHYELRVIPPKKEIQDYHFVMEYHFEKTGIVQDKFKEIVENCFSDRSKYYFKKKDESRIRFVNSLPEGEHWYSMADGVDVEKNIESALSDFSQFVNENEEKLVEVIHRAEEMVMTDEEKFKCLLEYFMAHLEYKQSAITNTKGYKTYIEPIIDNFTETGNGGKKDWGLQKQIEKWDSYSNGCQIGITINGLSGKDRFAGKTSYLQWVVNGSGTWYNVRAKWDDENTYVIGFYLTNDESQSYVSDVFSVNELGLNDGNPPNDVVKAMFAKFQKLIPSNTPQGKKMIEEIKEMLIRNHNIILHGAPGTGKTYLAKEIAKAMGCGEDEIGFVQFHQSYDYTDFVEGLRPVQKGDSTEISFERKDGVFKEFCKKAIGAHFANFDTIYKDFTDRLKANPATPFQLQTLVRKKKFKVRVNGNNGLYATPYTAAATDMPITEDNLRTYVETGEIKDWKPYVTAIGEYLKDNYSFGELTNDDSRQSKKFIFVIDEINRGEISKIFGELFFSIDPGYRGEKGKIKTQYQNLVDDKDVFAKGFYIPENVYIIGTMNDIDRSVESMDFAMRRRFAFKEIKADDRIEMLDSLKCGKKNEAVKCMRALNNEIEKISGLSSAYHIGPAYFLKLDNYEGNFEDLWKYHIEGVLREYLRGMPKATNLLTKLKDEYDKSIASGLSASSDDASGSAENP